jgi:hypothetical protein
LSGFNSLLNSDVHYSIFIHLLFICFIHFYSLAGSFSSGGALALTPCVPACKRQVPDCSQAPLRRGVRRLLRAASSAAPNIKR